MKRAILLLATMLVGLMAEAQQVLRDDFSQLQLHYSTPTLHIDATGFADAKYTTLSIEGYHNGGDIGSPAVPVHSVAITVPLCNAIDVAVSNAVFDTIALPDLPPYPLQPSRRKTDTAAPHLYLNAELYATNSYGRRPLAWVEEAGIARDRKLAHLVFAPVKVNPTTHTAIVCRSADVTLRYIDADSAATIDLYQRYHTPAFQTTPTLNKLFGTKGLATPTPQRMIIVAPRSLMCRRLENFAQWKRRQGMLVDIVCTDDLGLTTSAAIAQHLASLYASATATTPAPTYITLVGDTRQLPAFKSKLERNTYYGLDNTHVTDLYYATLAPGDNLPDCYVGRLSVTDTLTLSRVVNKTIYYESYSFADDSYLGRAVLVAGWDQIGYNNITNDYGYNYCDPSMDYVAKYYLNRSNGFNTTHYYKNLTTFAPDGVRISGSSHDTAAATHLKQLYNQGAGFINYTAHGEWDRWEWPKFNAVDAHQMTNTDKPSLMIGNCCLSSKFNENECLAEALLRRADNAGAVAYIGGTNYTYWDEDFYWDVGLRSNIYGTMNTAYNAQRMGMYDRLFHTHGEAYNQQCITTGAMVYAGNSAVASHSGNQWCTVVTPYYWEIYHLMGDPSLMPWIGTAEALPFSADTTSRPIRATTVPNAYVALVDSSSLQVLCAAFANTEGIARLDLPDTVKLSTAFFTASAQGYKPYIEGIDNTQLGLTINITLFPNPTSTKRCTVEATLMSQINVYSVNGHLLQSINPKADQYTIDLDGYQPGFYMIEVITADGTTTRPLVVQ